jgi:hypothetical protein
MRFAFEDLEERCDPVEQRQDDDEGDDGNVEDRPTVRREHTAVQHENADLSDTNCDTVLYSDDIEPLARRQYDPDNRS